MRTFISTLRKPEDQQAASKVDLRPGVCSLTMSTIRPRFKGAASSLRFFKNLSLITLFRVLRHRRLTS